MSPEQARPVVVTGAGGGIGAAIVTELSAAGHPVLATDLSLEAAERTAAAVAAGDVAATTMDITDPASVRAALAYGVARFGALGGVVNNAGWMEPRPLGDTDDAFLRTIVAINLEGPLRVCREALPHLRAHGSGRIVNIASDGARSGMSNTSAYSSAKGGVLALTRCLALELARDAVTVNCVSPGPTDTPLLTATVDADAGASIVQRLSRSVPLRRLATPADVAGAVRYFCSDAAAYVTGQTVSVSGGLVRT
jgi:2-hydroxycyclohexanecarboxyl-CoA dehydrogenase